jgi:hypothetical protein
MLAEPAEGGAGGRSGMEAVMEGEGSGLATAALAARIPV